MRKLFANRYGDWHVITPGDHAIIYCGDFSDKDMTTIDEAPDSQKLELAKQIRLERDRKAGINVAYYSEVDDLLKSLYAEIRAMPDIDQKGRLMTLQAELNQAVNGGY